MESFDIYIRVKNISISFNPSHFDISRWDEQYWDSNSIFHRDFKPKKPKKINPPPVPPEIETNSDDDFDPIPF